MASKTTTKTATSTKKKATAAVAKAAAPTGESPDGAKLTVLVETNPKKPGSAAHTRFALYKTGMTVAEFLAAGGTRSDLRWDTARNFVRLG